MVIAVTCTAGRDCRLSDRSRTSDTRTADLAGRLGASDSNPGRRSSTPESERREIRTPQTEPNIWI